MFAVFGDGVDDKNDPRSGPRSSLAVSDVSVGGSDHLLAVPLVASIAWR